MPLFVMLSAVTIAIWFVFSSINTYSQILFGADIGMYFGIFSNYQSGFLGYYIIGVYLMMRERPLERGISISLFAIGFIFSYALVYFDNVGQDGFNDRFLNFLAPNVLLMSVGVFEFIRSINWSQNFKFITLCSPLVIGVYYIHESILKILREFCGLVGYGYDSWYFIPIISFAVFTISVIISMVLRLAQGKRTIFF